MIVELSTTIRMNVGKGCLWGMGILLERLASVSANAVCKRWSCGVVGAANRIKLSSGRFLRVLAVAGIGRQVLHAR